MPLYSESGPRLHSMPAPLSVADIPDGSSALVMGGRKGKFDVSLMGVFQPFARKHHASAPAEFQVSVKAGGARVRFYGSNVRSVIDRRESPSAVAFEIYLK